MNLSDFARRAIDQVTESGAVTEIRLTLDGEPDAVATFRPPFEAADQWVLTAEAFVASLAAELPSGRRKLVFASVCGERVIEQCWVTVLGRGARAAPTDQGIRSIVQAMDGAAKLIDQLTATAAAQIEAYQRLHQHQVEQVAQLQALCAAQQENQFLQQREAQQLRDDPMLLEVRKALPALLDMIASKALAKG